MVMITNLLQLRRAAHRARIRAKYACRPLASGTAVARFREALFECDCPRSAFDRHQVNGRWFYVSRNAEDVAHRHRVWRWMRRPRGGLQLSFPDIARATGTLAWSTVVAACKGMK